LYAFETNRLWQINPDTGEATHLDGSSWRGYVALTSHKESLYAMEKGKLWRVNPNTGEATYLNGSSWRKYVVMTSHKNSLYAIEKGKLWRINPDTGKATHLNGSNWVDFVSLSSFEGSLYAIETNRFWRINPVTGEATHLNGSYWKGFYALSGATAHMWTPDYEQKLENLRLNWHQLINLDGTHSVNALLADAGLDEYQKQKFKTWMKVKRIENGADTIPGIFRAMEELQRVLTEPYCEERRVLDAGRNNQIERDRVRIALTRNLDVDATYVNNLSEHCGREGNFIRDYQADIQQNFSATELSSSAPQKTKTKELDDDGKGNRGN